MSQLRGARRPLSPTRARLLTTLRAQTEGTSLGALTALTGLHENTVRDHLAGLVRDGFARRAPSPPSGGRGRPAWLYSAANPEVIEARHDYVGLAATLASVIERRSPDPSGDAQRAGREWGRVLARDTGVQPAGSSPGARRMVVDLLTTLGFDPQTDESARVVRLTSCPMLEAAHRNPGLICSVHLGVVQGAMTQFGGDGTGSQLDAFAEPGACLLLILGAGEPVGVTTHQMSGPKGVGSPGCRSLLGTPMPS